MPAKKPAPKRKAAPKPKQPEPFRGPPEHAASRYDTKGNVVRVWHDTVHYLPTCKACKAGNCIQRLMYWPDDEECALVHDCADELN